MDTQTEAETPQIRYCIFDMDGLLLDTERIYTEATQVVFDRHIPGTKFTWELKIKIMGAGSHESASTVIRESGLQLSVDEYVKELFEVLAELFPSVAILPGVERLVRHLKAHNIPIAVATSSTTTNYNIKTQKIPEKKALFDLFDVVICGDDHRLKRAKPSPDIFQLAAAELQAKFGSEPAVEPHNCLVFEDSVIGLTAAEAAGMHSVWIPDENVLRITSKRDEDCEQSLPSHTVCLTGMDHFKPHDFGLPKF